MEGGVERFGMDSVEIVFVHGLSSDNKLLPTSWQQQFDIAVKGAFPELTRIREEGLIKGWGIGVNTPEPILRVLSEADPDVILMASQYSLINHKNELILLFHAVLKQIIELVVCCSLNAGFISWRPRYN